MRENNKMFHKKRSKLSEKCESLQKQSKKEQFKKNMSQDDHTLNNEMYHCVECEKVFNKEWKLNSAQLG